MSTSRKIRIRGEQREQIDADLMAQIVILMGRQLSREARGETSNDDETLPVHVPRRNTAPGGAQGAAV